MRLKKNILYALIMVYLVILLTGCVFSGYKSENMEETKNNKIINTTIDIISIKLINSKENDVGTYYSLEITNNSAKSVKQLNAYLSYPIKNSNSSVTNKLKAECSENIINLKPAQSIELHFFIPKENYINNNYLDREHPQFEVKGYIEEVKIDNSFNIQGEL